MAAFQTSSVAVFERSVTGDARAPHSEENDDEHVRMRWTGRILAGFALFMLGASIPPKLLGMSVTEENMAQLGWPSGYAFVIGPVE